MYTRRTATKTTKLEIMLTVRRLYLEVYLVVNNRILFIAIVFKLPKQIVLQNPTFQNSIIHPQNHGINKIPTLLLETLARACSWGTG